MVPAGRSTMKRVAAAQLRLDDPIVASPELALVDADLSAQLRALLPDLDARAPEPSLAPADVPPGLESAAEEHTESPVAAVAVTSPVEVRIEVDAVASVDDGLPDYVVLPALDVAEETASPGVEACSDVFDEADEGVPEVDAPQGRIAAFAAEMDDATRSSATAPTASFPTLPSLDARQGSLDEADAALRKIRDQLGAGGCSSRPRVRRRFVVLSGLSALAGLAALAADSHPQIAHLSGWLGA